MTLSLPRDFCLCIISDIQQAPFPPPNALTNQCLKVISDCQTYFGKCKKLGPNYVFLLQHNQIPPGYQENRGSRRAKFPFVISLCRFFLACLSTELPSLVLSLSLGCDFTVPLFMTSFFFLQSFSLLLCLTDIGISQGYK